MNLNCLNCANPLNLSGDINTTTSGFYGRCPNCGNLIILENGKLIAEPTFNNALEQSYLKELEQTEQIETNNNFLYLNKHVEIVRTIKRIFKNLYTKEAYNKKPYTNFYTPTVNKFDVEILEKHLCWLNKNTAPFNIQNLLANDKENILQTLKIINYVKQYKDKIIAEIQAKDEGIKEKNQGLTILLIFILFDIPIVAFVFSLSGILMQVITFIPKTIFPFIEILALTSAYYAWVFMLFSLVFYIIIIYAPFRFINLIKEKSEYDIEEYKKLKKLKIYFFMFVPLFLFTYIIPTEVAIAAFGSGDLDFFLRFMIPVSILLMLFGGEFLAHVAYFIHKKYIKKDSAG